MASELIDTQNGIAWILASIGILRGDGQKPSRVIPANDVTPQATITNYYGTKLTGTLVDSYPRQSNYTIFKGRDSTGYRWGDLQLQCLLTKTLDGSIITNEFSMYNDPPSNELPALYDRFDYWEFPALNYEITFPRGTVGTAKLDQVIEVRHPQQIERNFGGVGQFIMYIDRDGVTHPQSMSDVPIDIQLNRHDSNASYGWHRDIYGGPSSYKYGPSRITASDVVFGIRAYLNDFFPEDVWWREHAQDIYGEYEWMWPYPFMRSAKTAIGNPWPNNELNYPYNDTSLPVVITNHICWTEVESASFFDLEHYRDCGEQQLSENEFRYFLHDSWDLEVNIPADYHYERPGGWEYDYYAINIATCPAGYTLKTRTMFYGTPGEIVSTGETYPPYYRKWEPKFRAGTLLARTKHSWL